MNLKERARKLKKDIPILFMSIKDKETPFLAKLLGGITLAYALSPIDFIPDFIPVLGYLDDIILLPMFIALTIKLIPKEVWEKNREKLESNKLSLGKNWIYAIPIIITWIIIFRAIYLRFFD